MDTQGVREVLGVLLADGCLVRNRAPTKDRITAAMHGGAGEHSFLQEKATEIRHWIPTAAQITPYQTPTRDSGRSTTVLRFRFTSDKLLPIYNLLYPSGEREITRPALEVLGGRAAAWLWAEGASRPDEKQYLLRRVGQTESEARLVAGWLELLTGASSTVVYPRADDRRGKGLPRLQFSLSDAQRLQGALASYAPISRAQLFAEG